MPSCCPQGAHYGPREGHSKITLSQSEIRRHRIWQGEYKKAGVGVVVGWGRSPGSLARLIT